MWVTWRNEIRNGKNTKVPLDPKGNGQRAKADNPRTWAIRHQAEMAAPRLVNGSGGGIGIELTDIGDGLHLGGIDLDSCGSDADVIFDWAKEVITAFPTYWEVSPSRSGVKGYFFYRVADKEALRAAMGTDYGKQWKRGGGDHPPAIELYIGNRFFAVTDQHLSGTLKTIEAVSVDKLLWLIREAGPSFKGSGGGADENAHENALEDSEDSDGVFARLHSAAATSPLLGRVLGKMKGYGSRSEAAIALGGAIKAVGWSFEEMAAALAAHPETAEWAREKGEANGRRELNRIWEKAGKKTPVEPWGEPDMTVLKPARRPPPPLQLDVFGAAWARWIEGGAEAAAAPIDYVALPLLASASALIGHARWAEAAPGWQEPPHLWLGVVGDSGSSKSPGADCLMRDVLPEIERRMLGDFPDRLKEWRAAAEIYKAKLADWEKDVKTAHKSGSPPPMPPTDATGPEPQSPRLRQSDVTIERVAGLLATAAPKGLLLVRDELAGWLLGMNSYNDSGRAFWLEAYGGRPYRVERQKHPEPIIVGRLAVAVTGGTQPERLAEMFREADDGLMARIAWAWPEPKPFRISGTAPNADFAINALDKLRALEMTPETANKPAMPVYVPLEESAVAMMEEFGQDMQERQDSAGGLMRSAYGKARGLALRLSLVLGFLDWAASPGYDAPPAMIGEAELSRACFLVADYFLPMAERVYGDAAAPPAERNATTLARWILKERPPEVHVRRLQREVRLPGLGNAEAIHAAAGALVEADWLRKPEAGEFQARAKAAYPVNPAILAMPR